MRVQRGSVDPRGHDIYKTHLSIYLFTLFLPSCCRGFTSPIALHKGSVGRRAPWPFCLSIALHRMLCRACTPSARMPIHAQVFKQVCVDVDRSIRHRQPLACRDWSNSQPAIHRTCTAA
jgi:hypothetical protein